MLSKKKEISGIIAGMIVERCPSIIGCKITFYKKKSIKKLKKINNIMHY
jgi:hypothetical protein